MLLNADVLVAEAAERRKVSSKDKVKRVFQELCNHIAKNLVLGRGVNLPSFGLFGFQLATDISINGTPRTTRVPVFALSERFCRSNNLKVDKRALASGVAPAALPNYSAIGETAAVTKDECAAIIRDLLAHIGDAVRDERPCLIELGFGQFKYTKSKNPFVRFTPEFMRRLAQFSEQSARALSSPRTPQRPATATVGGYPSTVKKAALDSSEKRPHSASRTPRNPLASHPAVPCTCARAEVAAKSGSARPSSAPRERPASATAAAERPYSPLLSGGSAGPAAKAPRAVKRAPPKPAAAAAATASGVISASVLSRLVPGGTPRPATAPPAGPAPATEAATLEATGDSLAVEPPTCRPQPAATQHAEAATQAASTAVETAVEAAAGAPCAPASSAPMNVVCDMCRGRAAQLEEAAARRRAQASAQAADGATVRRLDRAALDDVNEARGRTREARQAVDGVNERLARERREREAAARREEAAATAAGEELAASVAGATSGSARPATAGAVKRELDEQLALRKEAQRAAEEARRLEVEAARRAAAALAEEERRRREAKAAQQRAVAGVLQSQIEEKAVRAAKEAAAAVTSLPGVEGLAVETRSRREEAAALLREQLAAAAARKAETAARGRAEREVEAAAAARVRAQLQEEARAREARRAALGAERAAAIAVRRAGREAGAADAFLASLPVGEELSPAHAAAAAERAAATAAFNEARRREREAAAAERAERAARERAEAAAAAERVALALQREREAEAAGRAERQAAVRRALDLQVAERAGRALLEARADAEGEPPGAGTAGFAAGLGEEAATEECACCVRCHGRLPSGFPAARASARSHTPTWGPCHSERATASARVAF